MFLGKLECFLGGWEEGKLLPPPNSRWNPGGPCLLRTFAIDESVQLLFSTDVEEYELDDIEIQQEMKKLEKLEGKLE